jgi:hypothetical protein
MTGAGVDPITGGLVALALLLVGAGLLIGTRSRGARKH